jgi:hypothetical protein
MAAGQGLTFSVGPSNTILVNGNETDVARVTWARRSLLLVTSRRSSSPGRLATDSITISQAGNATWPDTINFTFDGEA